MMADFLPTWHDFPVIAAGMYGMDLAVVYSGTDCAFHPDSEDVSYGWSSEDVAEKFAACVSSWCYAAA